MVTEEQLMQFAGVVAEISALCALCVREGMSPNAIAALNRANLAALDDGRPRGYSEKLMSIILEKASGAVAELNLLLENET